jgi:hypothetical protein
MKAKRTIIDTINLKLYMCGPGDTQIIAAPGTEVFQLEQSPSGHLILPVSDFAGARVSQRDRLANVPPSISLPVNAASASASSSSCPAPAVPSPLRLNDQE